MTHGPGLGLQPLIPTQFCLYTDRNTSNKDPIPFVCYFNHLYSYFDTIRGLYVPCTRYFLVFTPLTCISPSRPFRRNPFVPVYPRRVRDLVGYLPSVLYISSTFLPTPPTLPLSRPIQVLLNVSLLSRPMGPKTSIGDLNTKLRLSFLFCTSKIHALPRLLQFPVPSSPTPHFPLYRPKRKVL